MSSTGDISMRIIEEVEKVEPTKQELVSLALRLAAADILLRKTENLLKGCGFKEEESRAEANVIVEMIHKFRTFQ